MTTPLPLPTDRTLSDRLRAAEPAALADVYVRYGAMLVRAATWLTGSAADGEDIVQDLFVGLPEGIASFRGDGELGAWLRRIVVRMALMRLRAERRRREDPAEAAQHVASDDRASMSLGDRLSIASAVRALPDDLRTVFVLREIEGYSHAEIAERLGIRRNTAEVRLHRARLALRALLEERP